MTRNEFEVGARFFCGGHWWRCSDVGRRVIIAFRLDHEDDPTWYNGPPYAVAECVFDEYDQEGCFHTEQEAA